jgi:hypothetical protein
MSGWDAPTGSWDSGEEPEGSRSDDQGYQQTQPTGGYRAARGDGVLRAGRRGLPGYDQAQNYGQAGGYDQGTAAYGPGSGATAWSGADDQDGTQAFYPQQPADAGYGSLPGPEEDYRTQAPGQPGYDQPGYASQDHGQGAPGYQNEAYSRQGFESSGYAQRGYADQGYGPSDSGQNGYGQASGGTGTGYQQDSYGQGAYAQDGYGQHGTQAGYVQDGYGQGGYSPDAYRQEAYGQGAHGQDGYRQDGYGQDAYRQDAYGQGGYSPDAYRQEAYGQEAHRQDAYRQDGYGQDPFRQDGYGQEAYRQEAYGQEAYRQEAYGQGGYGQEAFAQPGIDRAAGPAYGDDGPGAPASQSRSGRSRAAQRSSQRLSGIRMVLYLLAAILGVVLIVWLVINLSKNGSTTTAGSTSSPSTSPGTASGTAGGTAAGTGSAFVFTKAAKVGTFPLNAAATRAYAGAEGAEPNLIAQGIKANGAGHPGALLIAVYDLTPVSNMSAPDYKAITFVGFDGTFNPDAVIKYMKTRLISTRMVSPGPHGGQMMCGYNTLNGSAASECVWVTPTTFGTIQFIIDGSMAKYHGTSTLAIELRNAVEVRAS